MNGGFSASPAEPPRITASARSASASYIGSSSGAVSARAARWRSTVARSPRAIGPVRAAGPRSAQLAAVRRTSGVEQLPRVLDAESLDELRGGLLQRDQQVRGDRRGGVVGGAALLRDLEGPHAERLGERAGEGERRLIAARDRGRRAVHRRRFVGEGLQRVEREGRGAVLAGRRQRVQSALHR